MRLTMGGEPTFVSVDDLKSPEWNIAAVGPTKRTLADDLIRKLRTRFAPGGLLHYGQGKWYPGETLPRWAFGLYWRKDGVPIWKNPDLIARIEDSRKADIKDALRFAEGTAARLGLGADYVLPAFEDTAYWLQKEPSFRPMSILNSRLSDPEERSRMARVFNSGLDAEGFCAADPALECCSRPRPLAQRALEDPARPPVPDAGRFAAWVTAADLLAGVRPSRGISLYRRAGSDGAARPTCGW